MFQLRGLGEDCAANPNDPVCRAFYGTDTKTYPNAILAMNLINPQTPTVNTPPSPNPLFQSVTPGTNIFVSVNKPWWASWWAIGGAALIGFGLWKYSRPKSSPASTAIAGLFKRRR